MQQIQDGQEDTHNRQIVVGNLRCLQYFLGAAGDKRAHQHTACQQHGDGDDYGGGQSNAQSMPYSLADALPEPGAQVLSHIGDHGIAVGGGGDFQYPIEFVGGGITGDENDSEAVDDGLYHQSAHGDDGVLRRHGGAQGKKLPGQPSVRPQMGWPDAQDFHPQDHP